MRTKVEKIKKNKLILLVLLLAVFIRVYKISSQPAGLMFDEVELGYQTYSLIKTDKDYFGNILPLHFESLADAKSPLYIYTSVPSILAFGLTPLGVRLPSVVFGVLGVWGMYLLVKQIAKNEKIAFVAGLLLAISPWHIQYSRGAYEVNIMLTLFLFGLYFFFKGLKETRYMVFSAIALALTPWAYSTAKLLLPVVGLILVALWGKQIAKLNKRSLLISIFAFIVVIAPITYSTLFQGGSDRFSYISIFGDPTVEGEVGYLRLEDARIRNGGISVGIQPALVDRMFHNKFSVWLNKFSNNYFENFSTNFLFVEGDSNLRHSVSGIGMLYKIELLFVLFGLVTLFSSKDLDKKIKLFIGAWILIAPLPASLTADGGGHATRAIFMLPPLVFLIAHVINGMCKNKLLLTLLVAIYLISFFSYQKIYWGEYVNKSEDYWYVGFEEMVSMVNDLDYDRVVFSMSQEPVDVFVAFWNKVDPRIVQIANIKEVNETLPGFGDVINFGNYYFTPLKHENLNTVVEGVDENTLYVAFAQDHEYLGLKLIDSVYLPSGRERFRLYTK